MQFPAVESALLHRDVEVAERFCDQFEVDLADAEEIFTETRVWVWLCARARHDRTHGLTAPRLIIDRPLFYIDEGWHNWLLHTRKYREFCQDLFGFFVDHNPTPANDKRERKAALSTDTTVLTATLTQREEQYSYIYDRLGGETLERWYSTLARKYMDLSSRRRL